MHMSETRQEWKLGWPMLAIAMIGGALPSFCVTTLGSLVKPLSDEYGWSRGEISTAVTIFATTTFLCATLIGRLVDRHGARRVALIGLCFYPLAMIMVGFAGGSIWTWYGAWLAAAILAQGVSLAVWAMAVVSRFNRARGMALGLMMSGVGIGYALIPISTVWLTEEYGWRTIYYALAGFTILVMLPLSYLFFNDASDLRRSRRDSPSAAAAPPAMEGMTFGEAMRTTILWRLVVSILIMTGASITLGLHIQPLLIDRGIEAATAAFIAGTYGPGMIFGRLSGGYILDRFPRGPAVAASMLMLPLIALLILLGPPLPIAILMLAPFCAGAAAGVEGDMLAYLSSRYFGSRSFGTIYGFLHGVYAIGTGVLVLVAGVIFDLAGSYHAFLLALAILVPVAAYLVGGLGPYTYAIPVKPAEKAPPVSATAATAAE